jgi:hypothetical protein
VSESTFALKLGKDSQNNSENTFWRADNWKTASFRVVFKFKSGVISVEDVERSGRPSASKTDQNLDRVK